jgi:hypothetical protein
MADLIALLLATLTGLLIPGVKEAQLEQKVRAAVLAQQPVPIKDVTVDCTGVSATKVDELAFNLTEMMMDPLLISQAQMKIGSVKPMPGGKVSISSIAWTADLSEAALTAALNAHVESLSSAKVKIEPDGITLSGKYKTMLGKMPFEVKGQLEIEDQTLLIFKIDKSKMTGIPVPKQVNKIIEREVNPIYDLAKFTKRNKKDIERAKEKLNYEFHLEILKMTPQTGSLLVVGKA